MATIYVAHDQFGHILSVVPEGGDVPVAREGVQVTEASVSGEMEQLEVGEPLSRRCEYERASRRPTRTSESRLVPLSSSLTSAAPC
jgi:hypothetical protein